MLNHALTAGLVAIFIHAPVGAAQSEPAQELPEGLYAVIATLKGDITVELLYRGAPLTVINFVGLAEGRLGSAASPGTPYYDGLTFHRVVPGFVIQGGDPQGTGAGGPGYTFQNEFNPQLRFDRAGIVGMANRGPDTNGSQFFITLAESNRLNYNYPVFGRVVDGMDAARAVAIGDTMDNVNILRIGDAANQFETTPQAFELLKAAVAPLPPMAENPKYFIDEANQPISPSFTRWLNLKLHHYEAVTGHRIYVRMHAGFLPRSLGDTIAAFCKDAAEALATGSEDGVLISWFADENYWDIRIGENLLALFMDEPMTVNAFVAGGMKSPLHGKKFRILKPAEALTGMGEPGKAVDAATTAVIEEIDR